MIIVLVPKLNTDTQGIVLLDILWRVVEVIIDTHLNACITFHEVLHGLCAVIVMGMTILELLSEFELQDGHPHYYYRA